MNSSGPVVVIDDDIDDHELLKEVTLDLLPDHIIRNFYNGKEALDYLASTTEQPFIIICDMNMPVMSGLELLETIVSNYEMKCKSIPFVFFSTAADQRSVQRSYDLGVQGFFKKPGSMADLKNILSLTFDFWKKCIHPNHKIFSK